jgi:hypothetical protein
MNSTTSRTQRAFDAQFVAEESSVRDRQTDSTQEGPTATRESPRVEGLGETVGERQARVDRKVHLARRLLSMMRPEDSLHRVFSGAVFRRDEILLDAALRAYAQRR